MKKLFHKLRRIVIACMIFALSYWLGSTFSFLYYYTVLFICPFAALFICFQLLLILYDMKLVQRLVKQLQPYLHPVAERIRSFISHAAATLLRLAQSNVIYQRLEYHRLRDTSRITGYSDEYHHATTMPATQEYTCYPLKWRKCTNDAQRIRYTYLKYVEANRKSGKAFSYSDTPYMLHRRWQPNDKTSARLLITSYYPARYGNETDQIPLSEEALKQLHNEWH